MLTEKDKLIMTGYEWAVQDVFRAAENIIDENEDDNSILMLIQTQIMKEFTDELRRFMKDYKEETKIGLIESHLK